MKFPAKAIAIYFGKKTDLDSKNHYVGGKLASF